MIFEEVQGFPLRRVGLALAVPPCGMLALLVWQVMLGHAFGKHPLSNASVVGWTVFLWIIYFRLITVRLVTQVGGGELRVTLRGLWRTRRIKVSDIRSAETIEFDPLRDYGGYGIRSGRFGTAYIANGNGGVRIKLAKGTVVVGSKRAEELAVLLSAGKGKNMNGR